MRYRPRPSSLLEKQAFKEVGCARGAAMRNRETQVRNARIEIVIEASDRAGELRAPGLAKLFGRQFSHLRAARVIGGERTGLDFPPQLDRYLVSQVSDLVGEAALA
jgi:hypothetical protein